MLCVYSFVAIGYALHLVRDIKTNSEMKKQTYQEKLKHPKWQKLRLEIMKRDKFKCKICKDEETTLNIHHLAYTTQDVWNEPKENLVTVCEHCHIEIENIKSNNKIIDFKNIYIEKSDNWKSGSRIMLIAYNGDVSIRIYDNNKQYIVGYNLDDKTVCQLNKILKLKSPF